MFKGGGVGGERRKEDEVWRGRRPGGRPGGSKVMRANQDLRSPASSLQSQRFPAEMTLNKEKQSEWLVTEGKMLSHTDWGGGRKLQVDKENKRQQVQ